MFDRIKYFKVLIKDYFRILIFFSYIKLILILGINEVWKLKNYMILDFVKLEVIKINKCFVLF